MASLTARWHRSIHEIPQSQWERLLAEEESPFYRWNWLAALESSGSVAPDQGWQPLHLSLWRDAPDEARPSGGLVEPPEYVESFCPNSQAAAAAALT